MERRVAEDEIARTFLQNENGDLREAVAAAEGRNSTTHIELLEEDTAAVVFEAGVETIGERGDEANSGEERRRKKTRLT